VDKMRYYQKELEALKRKKIFRGRLIYDETLKDFASNDYLGLSSNFENLQKALNLVSKYRTLSPKASQLVNGYHPIHKEFEEFISFLNGFESAISVGSGFLANISLIEALVRKGDTLFIDQEYHASGILPAKLLGDRVKIFRHNDIDDLKEKLESSNSYRKIIAIEGVYSMSGDIAHREIFDIAKSHNALLIIDEAHSSGVIGDRLRGVFEYYGITIEPNHIKMGTLGKAYGSYGAYICASKEIISYLENRAKPIIYSTAPSLIDTALALINAQYINDFYQELRDELNRRREVVREIFDIEIESQILPIEIGSNEKVIKIRDELLDRGYIVGAIREPTVQRAIIRVIPRVGESIESLKELLRLIKELS